MTKNTYIHFTRADPEALIAGGYLEGGHGVHTHLFAYDVDAVRAGRQHVSCLPVDLDRRLRGRANISHWSAILFTDDADGWKNWGDESMTRDDHIALLEDAIVLTIEEGLALIGIIPWTGPGDGSRWWLAPR